MPRKPSKSVPRTELDAAKHQSMLNFFAMIAYRKAEQTPAGGCSQQYVISIKVGKFAADLIVRHATSLKILSTPVVVVTERTGVGGGNNGSDNFGYCTPQVFDAFQWAHEEMGRPIDSDDQDRYDYRTLAQKVHSRLLREIN